MDRFIDSPLSIFAIFILLYLFIFILSLKRFKLLQYGKRIEKEAQRKFANRVPKEWKYHFNLYKREWHTDLDIFIYHPFREPYT